MNIYNYFSNPQQLPGYSKRNIIVPQLAYEYARYTIKDRWPEAEPYIAKHGCFAYLYALEIIKDRWPEAEPYIKQDPYWACEYALSIIKHRWPEAEPIIKQDLYWWNEYKKYFGIQK